MSQFNVAENVADLYKDRVHTREVDRFRTAHRNIISTYWNQYVRLLGTLKNNWNHAHTNALHKAIGCGNVKRKGIPYEYIKGFFP